MGFFRLFQDWVYFVKFKSQDLLQQEKISFFILYCMPDCSYINEKKNLISLEKLILNHVYFCSWILLITQKKKSFFWKFKNLCKIHYFISFLFQNEKTPDTIRTLFSFPSFYIFCLILRSKWEMEKFNDAETS